VTEALLSMDQCCFAYPGGTFRLDDVSLDVQAGHVVGLVGPNGAGKSTLLRLMNGLIKCDAGAVRLQGVPIHTFSRRRLATQIAFLPQSPDTSFRFSVRQVVAMGRYPYQGAFGFMTDHDVAVVEEAMRETDATALADRHFHTLSGGEKQRVLIASVLAQEPAAMLLDEPTAALDIHHKAEVFHLLRQLSAKGIAVVIVTHDVNAAAQFCDHLVVLCAGRVAAHGTPAEVMTDDLLSRVYRAAVRIVRNPVTSAPMAVVLGGPPHGHA